MLNRLRSDFYRLFHSPVVYIFPAFTVIATIASFFVTTIRKSYAGGTVSVYDMFGECLSIGLVMFITTFVLTSFYSAEFKNGYIKNVAGNIKNRYQLPICKLIVGTVILLINYVFLFIEELLSTFINKTKITSDVSTYFTSSEQPVHDWTIWFLITLLVYLMVNILVCFTLELTHSSAIGYIVSIFVSLNILDEMLLGVIMLLQNNFGILKMLEGSKIFILTPASTVLNYMTGDLSLFLPVTLFSVGLIVVFGGLSIILVKRKDIK